MQGEETDIRAVFLTSTVIVLILVMVIIIFVILYQKKILKEQSLRKTREAEHQFELLQSTLQTQEAERVRVAKDLHDDLGALLSTIKLYMSQYARKNQQDDALQKHTEAVNELLTEGIGDVRRISNDLLSPTLRDLGLTAALNELKDRINSADGLRVKVNYDPALPRLDAQVELSLYRIIQELLNNTMKHAKAKHAHLSFHWQDQDLVLDYRDDGQGVNLKTVKSHVGLRNLQSRATMHQGNMEFSSSPGKGFSARLQIPDLRIT